MSGPFNPVPAPGGMPQGPRPPFPGGPPQGGMPGAPPPGGMPPPPGSMPGVPHPNEMMPNGAPPSQLGLNPGSRPGFPPLSVNVPYPASVAPPGGHPGVVPLIPGGPMSNGARQPGAGFGPVPGVGPMSAPNSAAPPGPGGQPGMGMGGPPRPMGPPGTAQHGFGAPPGHPGMAPPGPPGMAPQGYPGMAPPGPPGMAPQGYPGMAPPGPPGMAPPGPPGMAPPGPSGMMPPGPPGMPPPGPPGAPGVMSPPGAPGMMPPPPMSGGFDPYQNQRNSAAMAISFETLTLGAPGPGMPDGVDLANMPRPVADYKARALAAQPLTDPGNCHPDNMRLTVTAVPNSASLRSRWSLPIGLVVQPMSDEVHGRPLPVVNLGAAGIVRCRRCRTYINPFVAWQDAGRRYKCNVCAMLNEVPPEYFCNLDHNNERRDKYERPELSLGTVEYIAPTDYMVRPPMPPVFFFVIDVSHAAVSSGMVATASAAIKSCLDKLPGDERAMVGLITFDSSIHYYNLKPSLSAPQMMVVTELEEPFVPLQQEDLLVNLKESREIFEQLLDSLPATFAKNAVVDSAMGPALQAAYMVMSHIGGKLLLFQASVASAGPGKVKGRENVSLYGTDREPTMRNPEDSFFKRFAAECSRVQITVDVFATSLQYMDLASLAAIPRFTCGELYFYPGFNVGNDGIKLHHEVVHNLCRPTAWEAVMRIRCSKGLRISTYHGHFFNRTTDLLALPTCDPDKGFAAQIALEDNAITAGVAYVQCALLYTSSDGERRIRVHTLSVPVVGELSDLYKGCDSAALACMLAKVSVEKSLTSTLDETRNVLQQRVMSSMKEFRILNASVASRTPNKLIYPESLRYLPLWSLGLLKSAALRGGAKDVNSDERIAIGHEIMSSTVTELCTLLYPSLYLLHDPSGNWGTVDPANEGAGVVLPSTMALSLTQLNDMGAYLLDNGRVFILWMGRMLHKDWGTDVFGVDIHSVADPSHLALEPPQNSQISKRICAVLGALRANRRTYQQVFVVRQGSPLEVHVLPYFVEDRSQATASYADYMMTMQKGVMGK